VVSEVITVGRSGTLVDWKNGGTTDQGGEQRAFVVRYSAEQIINWRIERVNGRSVVTRVVLQENAESGKLKTEIEGDEFASETVEQIRVLKLVSEAQPEGGNLAVLADGHRERQEGEVGADRIPNPAATG
jgi:hypothetical protein